MTDGRRRWAAAGLGLLTTLTTLTTLVGCDDDESAPLDDDDLPGEVTSTDTSTGPGFPNVGRCDNVNDAQVSIGASGAVDDGYRSWSWALEGGADVFVTVIEPGSPFTGTEAALSRLSEAITACAEDPQFDIVVEPLSGMPEGAVGYTTSAPSDDGAEDSGWQAFAALDDERVVGVGATSVDPAEAGPLLEKALDGAEGLELS